MEKKERFLSLSTKILTSILLILMTTFTLVVFLVYNRQRENLIENTDQNINMNSDMLMITLENMMLDGRAGIMVQTLQELQDFSQYEVIAIYRTNGMPAFSDSETIDFVNTFQDSMEFEITERLTDTRTETEFNYDLSNIQKSLTSFSLVQNDLMDTHSVEHYFPIFNQASCMVCHNDDHSIRGVAHIRMNIDSVYNEIEKNRNFLFLFFGSLMIFLFLVLILMLRSMVVKPVVKIQDTVVDVGEGDFSSRVNLHRSDEIGILATKVDEMIVRVEERVKLGRFVSQSTQRMISKGGKLDFGAEKKNLTLLFSDVRSFTSYSEAHTPETVIQNLNAILQVQTEAIQKWGGDIDKFVGDEIMALFEDPYAAIAAAMDMIRGVVQTADELQNHLRVGIGINTGEVVAGNIGHAKRLEYAVIGDTVNLAARLCSKAPASNVLISATTYEAVKDYVECELVSGQQIKGKSQAVDYYIVHQIFPKKDSE